MNPFNIVKNPRKKLRKKSNDEDPNIVFKGSFEAKHKVGPFHPLSDSPFPHQPKKKENEESEESKSNIMKPKKDVLSFKSRDSHSLSEMLKYSLTRSPNIKDPVM